MIFAAILMAAIIFAACVTATDRTIEEHLAAAHDIDLTPADIIDARALVPTYLDASTAEVAAAAAKVRAR